MTATEPRLRAHDRQSLLGTQREDSWRDKAACRDTDPDLFFPVGWTGPAEGQIQAAKAICVECTVREPCLDYAVTTNQEGIWGGTDQAERVLLRGERRRRAAEARA